MSVKQILSTKELTVNVGGKVYDVLLIPRDKMIDIDYSDNPYEHPKVKKLVNKIKNGEL